ncbi:hypothetical protein SD51_12865 [Alicyclobacillus tengchongensis]|nr:hypothetical protein SD51_12865 [Alicyclobacillus tengchongensis]
MQSGTMKFDADTERWRFQGRSEFWFHCGYPLQVRIANRYVTGTLEYADDWYVIFPETSFTLRRKNIYQVKA